MNCRLIQNISHSCDYNAGGITNIYVLDIRDFVSYTFSQDKLYDTCYVDKINTAESFLEISAVAESDFIETNDGGVYKQELKTFIHTLEAPKLSAILLASSNKHVVVFRTSQGKMYSFGSDGGASLSFSQSTGKLGEVAGYSITIGKLSIYPLFQINTKRFNTIPVLGTEDLSVVTTHDQLNAILIFANDSSSNNESAIQPDTYSKGTESSVFITIPTNATNGSGFLGYDYDNDIEQIGKPIERTYKTIVVGEYEWTQENLIAEFAGAFSWVNITAPQIAEITGRTDISPQQFLKTFGAMFGQYPETRAYCNFDKRSTSDTRIRFFRNRTDAYLSDAFDVEEIKWMLPDVASIYQLLGQAPRNMPNLLDDINDFVFTHQDSLGIGWDLLHRNNISGLSLLPVGLRGNDKGVFSGQGKVCGLQSSTDFCQHRIQTINIGNQSPGVALDYYPYHFTSVRYCRRLSDSELGYRLYVDESEDKVWMLDHDTFSTLDELTPSLERGIALRYINRNQRKVLKPWSEIKSEAEATHKSIIVN